MPTNLETYKSDLDKLITLGATMLLDFHFQNALRTGDKLSAEDKKLEQKYRGTVHNSYQRWYTEAHALLRQLAPDRLSEFEDLYKGDGKRKTIDGRTYNIQDWLNGIRSPENSYTHVKLFDDLGVVLMRFSTQKAIVESARGRFESTLFDIRQLVQADLFDSEIDAARELAKHKFLRAAGAVAGVVLEKHLGQVVENHRLALRKQHPTIGDLNEALKAGGVLDTPAWRNIQRLGDLRNLCDHSKQREPAADEINELIDGVEKITKTLF